MNAVYDVYRRCISCTQTLLIRLYDTRCQLTGAHAWAKPLMNDTGRLKPKISYNQLMNILGIFLHHCSHQLTRPIERSIAGTSTSPKRQWREIKTNWRVLVSQQALIGIPALHCLDTTPSYQIFRAAPAKKSFANCFPYQRNRSF